MKNDAFGRMSFELLYQCLAEGVKRYDKELTKGILQGIDSSLKDSLFDKAYEENNNRVWQLLAADHNYVITFCDEEDNDVLFLMLGVIKLDEKEYLVVVPYDEDNPEQIYDESDLILEIVNINGEEKYLTVIDEQEIVNVMNAFEEEYPEYWNLE